MGKYDRMKIIIITLYKYILKDIKYKIYERDIWIYAYAWLINIGILQLEVKALSF